MVLSTVRTYEGPEDYETAFVGARVEVLPIRRGAFTASVARIAFDRLRIARSEESAPRIRHVTQNPARAFVTFLNAPGPEIIADGVEMPANGVLRHNLGHVYHERSSGPTSWGTMSLPIAEMVAAGIAIGGCDLTPPRDTLRVTPAPTAIARLRRLHATAIRLAETESQTIAHAEVARAMEQSLIDAMVNCLSTQGSKEETWAQRCHETIMRRFRRVLDEHPDRALYIPEICAAISVPDRTLRLCCEEHLGMGPKKYLQLRRLALAHRAFKKADPQSTTVTEIATQYGFWHFSRFAEAYRSAFGELPSTTLNRPPN